MFRFNFFLSKMEDPTEKAIEVISSCVADPSELGATTGQDRSQPRAPAWVRVKAGPRPRQLSADHPVLGLQSRWLLENGDAEVLSAVLGPHSSQPYRQQRLSNKWELCTEGSN